MGAFEKAHGKLGFGCMRLPLNSDSSVNLEEFSLMIDEYIGAGFNYFDTAHGYLGGESEKALYECLVKRYPRDKYLIANKLSSWLFEKEADIVPLFHEQLRVCGVEYFDYYLMHAQNRQNYTKCKAENAYNVVRELKGQGKIKHFGISFHDKAEFLEELILQNPDIEFVQLQFNYYDYENENVQARLCYEIAEKYQKEVIVMEPVRGGSLVNLVPDADLILRSLSSGSNASYAIRFAAGFKNVKMVLSGMSNISQMRDNLSYMKDFKPLSEKELAAVLSVAEIIRSKMLIPCTSCAYCVEECPVGIKIPNIFSVINREEMFNCSEIKSYEAIAQKGHKASECIKCGACEAVCPQEIKVRDFLDLAVARFEK